MSAIIVLLGEDSTTERFIRRFLHHRRFRKRDIHSLPLPAGTQSGEQWVRVRYPRGLKAVRQRQGRFLVVIVDADHHPIDARRRELDEECARQNVPARTPDDPVIVIVPKRNIETWFEFLKTGAKVSETEPYDRFKRYDSRQIAEIAKKLYMLCHEDQVLPESAPPSLIASCGEYRRLRRTR